MRPAITRRENRNREASTRTSSPPALGFRLLLLLLRLSPPAAGRMAPRRRGRDAAPPPPPHHHHRALLAPLARRACGRRLLLLVVGEGWEGGRGKRGGGAAAAVRVLLADKSPRVAKTLVFHVIFFLVPLWFQSLFFFVFFSYRLGFWLRMIIYFMCFIWPWWYYIDWWFGVGVPYKLLLCDWKFCLSVYGPWPISSDAVHVLFGVTLFLLSW